MSSAHHFFFTVSLLAVGVIVRSQQSIVIPTDCREPHTLFMQVENPAHSGSQCEGSSLGEFYPHLYRVDSTNDCERNVRRRIPNHRVHRVLHMFGAASVACDEQCIRVKLHCGNAHAQGVMACHSEKQARKMKHAFRIWVNYKYNMS